MKHIPLFVLLVMMFVNIACGNLSPEPTPTLTPDPPTATLPPSTETPTSTPASTATATPDRTATAAVVATQAAQEVQDEFDTLLDDVNIPYKDGKLTWKQSENFEINMSGPDGRFLPFARNVKGKDFILRSDVTWNATGMLVCGAIFRSESNFRDGRQYAFLYLRLSGAPAWAIEYHEFGYFKNSPTGTKFSSAVDLTNGAKNQFIIIAQKGEFTVFINGVRQGKYFDHGIQRSDGAFAFVGYQDSGNGTCKYENTAVWELP